MNDSLETLLADGIIEAVIGQLKTGKEAEVWLVQHAGEVVAAKLYKERHERNFRNNAGYREGREVRNSRTRRAMEKGSRFGQNAAEDAWKSAESDSLYKLHAQGVRVPTPVMFYEGILLMEVVLDAAGHPAPRMVEAPPTTPEEAQALYLDLRTQVINMLCADLVHGDLSPYNILMSYAGPVIIDFPQTVAAARNNRAEFYFRRDLDNVRNFLAGIAPWLHGTAGDTGEIWNAYVRRELTPDFTPSGTYRDAPRRQGRGGPRDSGLRPPREERRDGYSLEPAPLELAAPARAMTPEEAAEAELRELEALVLRQGGGARGKPAAAPPPRGGRNRGFGGGKPPPRGGGSGPRAPMNGPRTGGGNGPRPAANGPRMAGGGNGSSRPNDGRLGGGGNNRPGPNDARIGSGGNGSSRPNDGRVGGGGNDRPGPNDARIGSGGNSRPGPSDTRMGANDNGRFRSNAGRMSGGGNGSPGANDARPGNGGNGSFRANDGRVGGGGNDNGRFRSNDGRMGGGGNGSPGANDARMGGNDNGRFRSHEGRPAPHEPRQGRAPQPNEPRMGGNARPGPRDGAPRDAYPAQVGQGPRGGGERRGGANGRPQPLVETRPGLPGNGNGPRQQGRGGPRATRTAGPQVSYVARPAPSSEPGPPETGS